MKFTFLFAVAIAVGMVFGASAQEITVVSWGGAYTKSQVEAYHKPFTAKTGIKINSVDSDFPVKPIKAQVEAGNVTIDVVDLTRPSAVRLCDEGLLEPIDPSILPTAPDGTPAVDDFVDGGIFDCAIANILWSTIVAYNTESVPTTPTSIADFYDLDKFPGKRGLIKEPKTNLEMALMGDGVPANEVYDLLKTEEGVNRAFAKMNTIKDSIVWWEAGSQPPQLLADKEVVMATAYNGRIFDAAVGEGQPLDILWDGQLLDFDLFAIPRGAPNLKEAMEFVAFATSTKPLADQASWISYGPARKSSAALVGKFKDGKTEMAPHMPTAPKNLKNALNVDFEFWADRDTELSERFNAWLSN